MNKTEERKLEGILLVITKPDNVRNADNLTGFARLGFKDGSVFYHISPLNLEITQEDLDSKLGKDYVDKMIKAGIDIAGNSYLAERQLPKKVEVWPSKDVPCVELRAYYFESEEPEVWSIALDLIKL